MARLLAVQAVVVGLIAPTSVAYALSPTPGPEAAKVDPAAADWEQGRPLWSLCEHRAKRAAASTPLKAQRQGPVAPSAEVVPSWSDCEGIDGVERAVFDHPVRSGGGMSRQIDDEDEAPICDGGTRCSPVPTERSRVISGITVVKAIAPPPARFRLFVDFHDLSSATFGTAEDGYPSSLFEPPQPAV